MYLLQLPTIVTGACLDERVVRGTPAGTVPVEELERAAMVSAESKAKPVPVGGALVATVEAVVFLTLRLLFVVGVAAVIAGARVSSVASAAAAAPAELGPDTAPAAAAYRQSLRQRIWRLCISLSS